VIEVFNEYFFGREGQPGLMERERWIAEAGVLERLNQVYDFAIFTGRLHEEAQITLRRFGSHLRWFAVLGDDNVAHSKPHPDGLQQLQTRHPAGVAWYLGDSIDDGRAAAAAGVPFIGISVPGGRFEGLSPKAVLGSINELERFLQNG
jgi:HAD superfamily hydrolase (TIGR01549 family)